MTADAVGSYPPLPDHQPHRTGAAALTVRLIRESYAHIQPHAAEATQFFYAMLFAIAPATRELFAANMEVQRSRFWRALVHIVQHVDRPDELIPFLHQLGRDHRKFGVLAPHYDAVGTALLSSAFLICAAVALGLTALYSAAAPVTCGVAIEVPL